MTQMPPSHPCPWLQLSSVWHTFTVPAERHSLSTQLNEVNPTVGQSPLVMHAGGVAVQAPTKHASTFSGQDATHTHMPPAHSVPSLPDIGGSGLGSGGGGLGFGGGGLGAGGGGLGSGGGGLGSGGGGLGAGGGGAGSQSAPRLFTRMRRTHAEPSREHMPPTSEHVPRQYERPKKVRTRLTA